jgi:hypothetical protein
VPSSLVTPSVSAAFRPPSTTGLVTSTANASSAPGAGGDSKDIASDAAAADRPSDASRTDGQGRVTVTHPGDIGHSERKQLLERGVRPKGTDIRLEQGNAFWEVDRFPDFFKYETLFTGIGISIAVILFFVCIIVVLTM